MISKIKANVRELGWINAFLYGLDRGFRRFAPALSIYRYYFVAQPVPDAALLAPGRGATIAVRQLVEHDPALQALPVEERVVAARYRHDAICFGAFRGETVIGCLWLCFDRYVEDEVASVFMPRPSDRAAWDFDLWIDPKYRIGFAFARLWDSAYAYLRERGYRWTVSRISAFNAVSLNSHAKLGAVRVGSLFVLRAGRAQFSLSSVRPFVSVCVRMRNMPEYRIVVPGDEPGPEHAVLTNPR